MKKPLLSVLFSFFVFQIPSYAQTLTATWCNPQIGEVFTFSDGPYIVPGAAGSGQTWDFGAYTYTASASTTIMAASAAPTVNLPSPANIVAKDPYLYMYLNASPGGLEIVGYYSPFGGGTTKFTDAQVIQPYPFSLGNTTTDTYTNTTSTSTGSYTASGTITITADASGTITTLAGVFNDVLRVRYTERRMNMTNLTLFENYYWYKPGVHKPVFAVYSTTYNAHNPPPNTVEQSSKFFSNPVDYLGIDSYDNSGYGMKLFPNPASGDLYLQINSAETSSLKIRIFNLSGMLVLATESRAAVLQTDVSRLPAGLYFAEIDADNKRIGREKIIISR